MNAPCLTPGSATPVWVPVGDFETCANRTFREAPAAMEGRLGSPIRADRTERLASFRLGDKEY